MEAEDNKEEMIAKLDINDLMGIGFTILVLVIYLAYGLNVVGDVKADLATDSCPSGYAFNTSNEMCYNVSGTLGVVSPVSAEYNASVDGLGALSKIPSKMSLIVTILLAAIVIGILVTYLWIKYK